MLDLLTSLADKSLVLAEERSGTTRYRLLETVRAVRARSAAGERRGSATGATGTWRTSSPLRRRRSRTSRALTSKAWLDRLETEHDNFRSALTWSSAAAKRLRKRIGLAGALFRFWYVRGYFGEGRGGSPALLAREPTERAPATRAKALHAAGAWRGGRATIRPPALHEESLAICATRRPEGIAAALSNLGLVAFDEDDYPSARAMSEESLAIQRELGDRRGIADSLNNLAIVASDQGDYATARASYEESLAIRARTRGTSGNRQRR